MSLQLLNGNIPGFGLHPILVAEEKQAAKASSAVGNKKGRKKGTTKDETVKGMWGKAEMELFVQHLTEKAQAFFMKLTDVVQFPAARCDMGPNIFLYNHEASSGVESMNNANKQVRAYSAVHRQRQFRAITWWHLCNLDSFQPCLSSQLCHHGARQRFGGSNFLRAVVYKQI